MAFKSVRELRSVPSIAAHIYKGARTRRWAALGTPLHIASLVLGARTACFPAIYACTRTAVSPAARLKLLVAPLPLHKAPRASPIL